MESRGFALGRNPAFVPEGLRARCVNRRLERRLLEHDLEIRRLEPVLT
jgi:uncharacterized protein (UPF0297 family)